VNITTGRVKALRHNTVSCIWYDFKLFIPTLCWAKRIDFEF